MSRMASLASIFVCLAAVARADPWEACLQAVSVAEAEAALPAGLLAAVARTESGRRHPVTGRLAPWPFALNAAGMGMHAASRSEAIATVGALQARGVRSIDVGCLQVNLLHHPGAFPSLEEAFDPLANARYAARFLRDLHTRAGGDWGRAVGWYHSATAWRGETYRRRVMAQLTDAAYPVAAAPVPPPLPRADPIAPLLAAVALRVTVILPGGAPVRSTATRTDLPRVVTPRAFGRNGDGY